MTTLLLIDVQKDFHPGGSLAIPTADADAERTASFIRENTPSINRIVATLDSHHKLHIAHPCFWTDADGNHPAPFTIISMDDIVGGKWIPRKDLKHPVNKPLVEDDVLKEGGDIPTNLRSQNGQLDIFQYCIEYTRRLEAKGRFKLCIWPEHCLIGTSGHNVVDSVREAMDEWSHRTGGSVEWVDKGANLLTEMYSALCAEVPINGITKFDYGLLDSLKKSEKLIICGQAMSHCVNYTVRDIVSQWPKDEVHKITLLTDCASSVPGFEEASEQFLNDMKAVGISLETLDTLKALKMHQTVKDEDVGVGCDASGKLNFCQG